MALIALTAPPGSMGITVKRLPQGGGAEITRVGPLCPFGKIVKIGDTLLSINGKELNRNEDLGIDRDISKRLVFRPAGPPVSTGPPVSVRSPLLEVATAEPTASAEQRVNRGEPYGIHLWRMKEQQAEAKKLAKKHEAEGEKRETEAKKREAEAAFWVWLREAEAKKLAKKHEAEAEAACWREFRAKREANKREAVAKKREAEAREAEAKKLAKKHEAEAEAAYWREFRAKRGKPVLVRITSQERERRLREKREANIQDFARQPGRLIGGDDLPLFFSDAQIAPLLDLVKVAKPYWNKHGNLVMNLLGEQLGKCIDANLSSKEIRYVLLHLVCEKKLVHGESMKDATGYKQQHVKTFAFRTRKTSLDIKLSEKEYLKRRKKMMKLLKKRESQAATV